MNYDPCSLQLSGKDLSIILEPKSMPFMFILLFEDGTCQPNSNEGIEIAGSLFDLKHVCSLVEAAL